MMEIADQFEYAEGLHGGYKDDPEKGNFFQEAHACPFCQRELDQVFSGGIIEYNPEDKDSSQDINHSVTAKACQCGWWVVYNTQTKDAHDLYALAGWTFYYRGYLRKLKVAEPTPLLNAVKVTLYHRSNVLDLSDPRNIEDVVGSVMGLYQTGCHCAHCGKSADGRTDLISGIATSPFAMKIEHSEKDNSAFTVQYVTHLIGVVLKDDSSKELLFSTEPEFEFPNPAKAKDAEHLKKCAIDCVRMTNENSLCGLLATTSKSQAEPWKRCIPDILVRDHGRLTPYSVGIKRP